MESTPHPSNAGYSSPFPPQQTAVALALIFSILLMDVIGFTLLSPVAPYLVARYDNSALAVTLITVSYAVAQFFAAPFLGKLGDRYGRRPVLLISLLGQGIGYFIFGMGGALWILLLGRFIGGVTGGNMSTATAYIADISSPERRARNFGLIGMAWALGLILGPAAGAIFGQINLAAPAFAAAVLSLVNVLLGLFWLPESLPSEYRDRSPLRLNDFNPISAIFDMGRKPGLGWVLVVLCLFNFSFNGVNSTSTFFFIEKFGVQPWQTGLLLGLTGVALAFVQFVLVQRVVSRFGEKRVAMSSLFGQAVFMTTIFFAPAFWIIYPLNMLNGACSSFTFPTLTTLTTDRVSHREVGLLMGVTTALGSLMNIFGPLWAGMAYEQVMPGAPYWMGALIFAAAALILQFAAPSKG